MAPANVLQGAVRLQGLTSSPTPDTQVRVAWAWAIEANANNTGNGINSFATGTGSVTLDVGGSLFAFNARGVNLGGVNAKASIRESIVTNNSSEGLRADGSTLSLTASNNEISHNGTGVFSATSAVTRIGANTITFNTTGLNGAGATLCSFGSNFVDGNTANGAVTGACAANQ